MCILTLIESSIPSTCSLFKTPKIFFNCLSFPWYKFLVIIFIWSLLRFSMASFCKRVLTCSFVISIVNYWCKTRSELRTSFCDDWKRGLTLYVRTRTHRSFCSAIWVPVAQCQWLGRLTRDRCCGLDFRLREVCVLERERCLLKGGWRGGWG